MVLISRQRAGTGPALGGASPSGNVIKPVRFRSIAPGSVDALGVRTSRGLSSALFSFIAGYEPDSTG